MPGISDRPVTRAKNHIWQRRNKACLTCKIRRVKCSYERPSCQRCLSTGRKCDGYPATEPTPPNDDAPVVWMMVMARPAPAQCDHAALTAFQFFTQVCAPALLNYGSQRFWNELVLQACYVDESIKHLTIAASRLGRHHSAASSRQPADWDPVFLSHYGKALKLLSGNRNPDPSFLLMACLLLILCDEFRDHSFAALQHLIAGRRILATYQPSKYTEHQLATVEELGPIFARLELQTGELYSQVRPLPQSWQLNQNRKSWLLGDIQHYSTINGEKGQWTSVDDAARLLQAITSECTSRQVDGPPPPTRFHTVPTLTTRLNEWLDQYTLFESSVQSRPTHGDHTDLYLLRMYHSCVYVLSRCEPFKQELAFDSYSSNIEHVMVVCAFLVRTAKMRIIPILFFVGTRYRNASVRRRAIGLLKQCGLDGQLLARIAVRVVRLEEKSVTEPIVCSDVPEESRLRLVDMLFDVRAASYILRFKRRPYGDDTALESVSIPAPALSWDPEPRKPVHACELLKSVLRFNFMAFWNQDDPAFAVPAGFGVT
ncbi:hypothetical protein CLCR_08372 [Cladophialophora carrionii]|uniref:Zn(2)-C6 fungal-type domain-containing protein n=1 Tax=Cladophialophora carrionii TaxID=86049 RepID=A0A1C1CUQ3_9EURO|nr:hypothetical protein CLCR_08372 [Cladophialophora carrionii]